MTKNIDFVWPEYKSDRERIKAISKKYKDLTITEAFESEYAFKSLLTNDIISKSNSAPIEPQIGDIMDVSIISIDKNKVLFDTLNLKTEMISKVNLYKYDFFKKFTPKGSIKVMVSSIDKRKIAVDPITPLMEQWMHEYIGNKDLCKIIGAPKTVKVKNLRLTKGGFLGDVSIKHVADFIHEDYDVPAFIPGSQIVLNIAEDFESFIGKDVDAFAINYIKSADNLSLICSSKEYYKFLGECNMVKIFNAWCEDNEYWKTIDSKAFDGKVTGIINSSKKCGVFVEIPELYITGLVTMKPEELVGYKPHSDISVKIKGFDEETYYNQTMQQMQHIEPYVITDGVLMKCNLKPVLELA